MTSILKVDTIQDQDGNNIINENADTITIGASGDTITIPAGATLSNLGTATGFGSIAWQSSIVTAATLTAVSGNGYWINTTSNACTITLPASAAVGDQIIFVDYARTWATNAVTINQNGLTYQGGTDNPVYDTDGQTVNIIYSGATNGWIPISDDDVADEGTIPPYSIDFLVVAGGGGAGGSDSGGAGAGGYRTSTQLVNFGTTLTITVGDGGAGSTGGGAGFQGSDSSISGAGVTTITSAGGGKSNGSGQLGSAGGSGAGNSGNSSNANSPGAAGNTPSTAPSQGNRGGLSAGVPYYGSGGGGGAGAVGGGGTTTVGANGGVGTVSSISGPSTTRAGGGGGATFTGGPGGTGGTGGGGNAGTRSNGTAGAVNTGGGGGGGSESPYDGGAGGKGVVILSMPLANFSNTVTGSPTESDDGTTKVLIFNGDGSYTA